MIRASEPSLPKIAKLSRKRGYHLPPGTVICDRRSIFGNPFPVTPQRDAAQAVREFEAWLRDPSPTFDPTHHARIWDSLDTLRQAQCLGCWCLDWDGRGEIPTTCHCGVYIKLIKEYNDGP